MSTAQQPCNEMAPEMIMPDPLSIVLVTAASEAQAAAIARHLLDEQLAACVNLIGPMRSLYRWAGAVQDEREWQLLIKTRRALFPAVVAAVQARHSYENPEIVALSVEAASEAYGRWVVDSTRS